LEQIHTDNVTHLVEAWRYPLPRRAAREPVLAGGYELTPLAIGGVLYAAAADRVVALDGASGRELWRHRVAGEPPSRRGLAYWPGGEGVAARLFYIAGRRLVALDASTGEPVAAFGTGGAVGLAASYDAAPTRFEDLLIVGARMPASVRAFDARTGTEVWAFDAAPASGGEAPSTASRAFSVAVDVDRALARRARRADRRRALALSDRAARRDAGPWRRRAAADAPRRRDRGPDRAAARAADAAGVRVRAEPVERRARLRRRGARGCGCA